MAGAGRDAEGLTRAELEALVAELRAENAALRVEIEDLKRRVSQDSSNSSRPPSSDPPLSRAERRRRAREKAKELSRRKPGGQPGHEGKHRPMVAAERLDRRTEHLPEHCDCGHSFDGSEQRVGDPLHHQRWELPPIRPLIFQYELIRLRCPCCAKPTLADLPKGVTWERLSPVLKRTSPRWRASTGSRAA